MSANPPGASTRGLFLTVEGVEGAGKTTQVALLAERLRGGGREVLVVREPGGTPLAEEARRLFLDPALALDASTELFLVLVARADLVQRVVRPALAAGTIVLADRFDLSTRAYQIGGRGLPDDDVIAANRLATGGLAPDLVIVLDVAPEVGQARQAARALARRTGPAYLRLGSGRWSWCGRTRAPARPGWARSPAPRPRRGRPPPRARAPPPRWRSPSSSCIGSTAPGSRRGCGCPPTSTR